MLEPTSTLEAPSTSQFTALRRDPLIEMLVTLVSPTPTSSGRSLLTPGTRVASWMKLRLLRVSSSIWVGLMSDCRAEVGWIREAAVTSTCSVIPPSLRATSIFRRSFTCSRRPRACRVWKPWSWKVRS